MTQHTETSDTTTVNQSVLDRTSPMQEAPVRDLPPIVRRSLCLLLVTASIVSVPAIGHFGPLPTTILLDVWIVGFLVLAASRGRIHVMPLIYALSVYLLGALTIALLNSAPLIDFLQAYRWVFYLIVLSFAIGRHMRPTRAVIATMWTMLALANLKALLTIVILGPGERPGLLLENNFELALFGGLIAVLAPYLGKAWPVALLLMGMLTVMAGSRSGAVVFVIVAAYTVGSTNKHSPVNRLLLAYGVPALGFVAASIFAERAAGERRIDRLNFFDVFVDETRTWTPLTWLFGNQPITPVSSSGCSRLSFYDSLFSSAGDGTCYSVIFHAFLMRVIFDSGILGALAAFGAVWYLMRKAGVAASLTATLVLIAIANSASVSGLNNPYVVLPILLAIITSNTLGGRNGELLGRGVASTSRLRGHGMPIH